MGTGRFSNASEADVIAARLTEMISQVLDMSRLESGQMPFSLKETDLVALLPAAVASLGPPPENNQCRVRRARIAGSGVLRPGPHQPSGHQPGGQRL
jgi:signal transduction histidine kinase